VEITFFYIPVADATEAITIGDLAVSQKLAACANHFPIQSVFPWEGVIQHNQEFVLILKTLPSLKSSLRSFLEGRHSYATPCILCWEVEVNEPYKRWMEEQLISPEQKGPAAI